MEVAISTYVAQNWGARNLERVRTGVSQAFRMVIAEAIILGILLVLLSRPLVHLFIGDADPAVVDLSAHAVELCALTYWILGVLFVARGALQGLGRMRAPFWSGAVELVLRVLAAVWLGGIIGFMGVVAASPLAWAGAVALLLPSYLRVRSRLLDDDALAAAQARPLPVVRRRPRLPGRGRPRRSGRAARGEKRSRLDGSTVEARRAPIGDGLGPDCPGLVTFSAAPSEPLGGTTEFHGCSRGGCAGGAQN